MLFITQRLTIDCQNHIGNVISIKVLEVDVKESIDDTEGDT